MSQITIVRTAEDLEFCERLRSDLVAREWSVLCHSPASTFQNLQRDSIILFILPQSSSSRKEVLIRIDAALSLESKIILLDSSRTLELPTSILNQGVSAHLSINGLSYDRVFEDLYRALLGPFPSWLDLRVRPSLVLRPTGTAWWSEDLFVADEGYEHVVRLGPSDSNIVLPGLMEPQHIHLDRRNLVIANKSADEVLVVGLDNNTALEVQSIRDAAGPLRRPHAATYSFFSAAIADTDHHRVTVSRPGFKNPVWTDLTPILPFNTPCAMHLNQKWTWVVDTFNHRVVMFDMDGRERVASGEYGDDPGQFKYPVGLISWGNLVFVADEETARLQVLRLKSDSNEYYLSPLVANLGAPWIVQPFGLSINRENRLAVADRAQKCVWIIDLKNALSEIQLARGFISESDEL